MKPTDYPGWVLFTSGKRVQATWLEVDKQTLLSALCDEHKQGQKMLINCEGIDCIIPTITCYSIEVAIIAANAINRPVVFQNLMVRATAHIPSALRLCDERGNEPMNYLFGRGENLKQFGITPDTCNLVILPKKVTGDS